MVVNSDKFAIRPNADLPVKPTEKPNPTKNDVINHPAHYKTKSGLEAIQVIEAFTEDLSWYEATHTGQVLKYMCRWKKKNGIEDLKKARFYLDRLITLLENKEKGE